MAYADEGIDQRTEILSGPGVDTLVYYAKANGSPVTVDPGSAYVTVLDPTGTVRSARTTATIGSGGRLSFSTAWPPDTYPLAENYFAVWEWTVGGAAYSDQQMFDVVKNKLPVMIDTSDLEEIYPNLSKHLLAIEVTDASRFVKRAWSMMLDRIRAAGYRPSLIMDRSRLVNPAIQLALSMASDALSREAGDLWDQRADRHRTNYENLFAGLGSLTYDTNESGTADETVDARINRVRAWV